MKSTTRRFFLRGAVGVLAANLLAAPIVAHAQDDPTPVHFGINWAWQGPFGIWTLAKDSGCFAEEGLDVSLNRGYGSSDSMSKLAAGNLDFATVDPNLLPKFNSENPDHQLIASLIIYDAVPSSVVYLKASGIEEPKDLEGHSLALVEGASETLMFPIFAEANGIDMEKVDLLTVAGQLRDAMLVRNEADASVGSVHTVIPNLVSAGIPMDEIGYFSYNQYGLELYAEALVTRKDYAEANPDVMRSFIECAVKGVQAMVADPQKAIESVMERDNTLEPEVELLRMELVKEASLLTPHVREHGLGSVDLEAFQRSLDQVAVAFSLPFKPKVEDIYTDEFLPPKAERMIE